MLPATCPPNRMVRFVLESSPSILAHLAMNAALSAGSLAVNAAIRLAAGSRCCSKKIGRSPSVTSRSRTSLVMRHSRQTLDAASNVILLNDPRRRTSDLRNRRRHNIPAPARYSRAPARYHRRRADAAAVQEGGRLPGAAPEVINVAAPSDLGRKAAQQLPVQRLVREFVGEPLRVLPRG